MHLRNRIQIASTLFHIHLPERSSLAFQSRSITLKTKVDPTPITPPTHSIYRNVSIPFSRNHGNAFDLEALYRPVQVQEVQKKNGMGSKRYFMYMKKEAYEERLNSAFGRQRMDPDDGSDTGWAMVPLTPMQSTNRPAEASQDTQSTYRAPPESTPTWYYQTFALYVHDQFISEAMGCASDPEDVSYAALVRCCKDLCVASELWDPDQVRKLSYALYQLQQNQRPPSEQQSSTPSGSKSFSYTYKRSRN